MSPAPDTKSIIPEKIRQGVPPALCLLAGFLTPFLVPLVGQLPLGEVILVLISPWVILAAIMHRGWAAILQQTNWFKILVALIAIMFFGYFVSDWYRHTSTPNLIRGWARVIFLGLDLLSLSYLFGAKWSRFWMFLLAAVIGRAVQATIYGPVNDDYWKFGYGFTVSVLALFFAGRRSIFLQVSLCLALGVLHLFMGARSMGGICLLTGGLLTVHRARGLWRPLTWAIAMAGVALLLWSIQSRVEDEQNHSGSNVERQAMLETAGDLFLDSPLIGQGSWFTTRKLAKLEEKRRNIDGTFLEYTAEEAEQIAIHSQLLVSLAEGGILGGVFFVGYGIFLLVTFRSASSDPIPRRALVLFLLGDAFWNLLMSPFASEARVWIALAAVLCLLTFQHNRGLLEEVPVDE